MMTALLSRYLDRHFQTVIFWAKSTYSDEESTYSIIIQMLGQASSPGIDPSSFIGLSEPLRQKVIFWDSCTHHYSRTTAFELHHS